MKVDFTILNMPDCLLLVAVCANQVSKAPVDVSECLVSECIQSTSFCPFQQAGLWIEMTKQQQFEIFHPLAKPVFFQICSHETEPTFPLPSCFDV